MVRRTGAALGAALLVGLASGLVARLLMRLVAVALDEGTSFTVEATAGIALVFVVLLLPAAVAGAFVRARWRFVGTALSVLLLGGSAGATAVSDGLADLGDRPVWSVLLVALALIGFLVLVVAAGALATRTARGWSGVDGRGRGPTRPSDGGASAADPGTGERVAA